MIWKVKQKWESFRTLREARKRKAEVELGQDDEHSLHQLQRL